jgi:endonuclease YncB( thermonuclease family)
MRRHRAIGRLAGLGTLVIWVTVAAAVRAADAIPEEVVGTATIVTGDVLEVQGHRVHLFGVDAPEPGQVCRLPHREYDCGRIAATALMDLSAGATVRCVLHRKADDHEFTGLCIADGYDLSEGMAYTGWALALPGEGNRYGAVEESARSARRGLWRGDFVRPWDWRSGVRLEDAE